MFKAKNTPPPLRDIDKKDPMLKTRFYLPRSYPHSLPLYPIHSGRGAGARAPDLRLQIARIALPPSSLPFSAAFTSVVLP